MCVCVHEPATAQQAKNQNTNNLILHAVSVQTHTHTHSEPEHRPNVVVQHMLEQNHIIFHVNRIKIKLRTKKKKTE